MIPKSTPKSIRRSHSEIKTALADIQSTLKSLVEAVNRKSDGATTVAVKREDDPNYIVSFADKFIRINELIL